MLSNDEIVQLVRLELTTAQGYDSDYLGDLRARSLDYYFGNTQSSSIPAAPIGRCNIVSMDVHDSVNAQLADLIPLMRSALVKFCPRSEEDEPAARMESDFVANLLEEQGFDELAYDGCFDALLQGLGWWKVEVDERTETVTENLGRLITDPLERQIIIDSSAQDETFELIDGKNSTSVRISRTIKALKIGAVAPEHMLYSPDHSQYDIDTVRFVAERRIMTVDELVKRGLPRKEAQEIEDFQHENWVGNIARKERYYGSHDPNQGGWQDATRLKETFMCYMELSLDNEGDGPTQRYFIHLAGWHIVEMYPVPFHPYVVGSPLPVSHRIMGRGMYEVMADVQKAKTSLIRHLVDNAMVANGSRTAYNENVVNTEHLTDGRINGNVAVNGLPHEHIMQMPGTDITGHMVGALTYLDSVRESRGGAAIELNESDKQVMKGSAEAASGLKQSKEKMAAYYTRNLCNTFLKGLYLKVHRTLRTNMAGTTMANLRGEWVQTDPGQWPFRGTVKITNGLTELDKRQTSQSQIMLMQALTDRMAQGGAGIITDVSKMYNLMAEWIRTSGIGKPEDYLIDPNSPEAMENARVKMDEAISQQEMARQIMEQQRTLEEMQMELDKYKFDKEDRRKYWEAALQSETELTTTRMDNEADLQKVESKQVQ